MPMPSSDVSLDGFVQFLVDRSTQIVGYSGVSFFRNPLAEWLTSLYGCLVAVDTDTYCFVSSSCLRSLPCWARRLMAWLEACTPVPLTGEMVFSVLADIEVGALLPRI
jgi:hypothetical protein